MEIKNELILKIKNETNEIRNESEGCSYPL